MKYLKTYNKINEGLRDKMVGKSDEELINSFKELHPNKKIVLGVEKGVFKLVKMAIDEGVDINKKMVISPSFSVSPRFLLETSIRNQNIDIIKLLLDNLDNVGKYAMELQSPIIYLVLVNNLEVLKLLEKYNIRPMYVAGWHGSIENIIEKNLNEEIINYLCDNYGFISDYVNSMILKIEEDLKKWKNYER